jgi:CRISPR-associated protein Csb2
VWLALQVRFADPSYHGVGDKFGRREDSWPPSPARLFQALISGSARGRGIGDSQRELYCWLEELPSPVICAPRRVGKAAEFNFYPPPNDRDKVGGDPARRIAGEKKWVSPTLIESSLPLIYLWRIEPSERDRAEALQREARRLYQLGRGVDFAWAECLVLEEEEGRELLASYRGEILEPGVNEQVTILSPVKGSFQSLVERHKWQRVKVGLEGGKRKGAKAAVHYSRPPAPLFQRQGYGVRSHLVMFELVSAADRGRLADFPLERAPELMERLRDLAIEKWRAVGDDEQLRIVERYYVGRRPDGSNDCPTRDRPRIVPIPSLGHVHADRRIRRFCIEVPSSCPIDFDDIAWSFDGLELTGAGGRTVVTSRSSRDPRGERMCGYLGIGRRSRRWMTVTPAALPFREIGVGRSGDPKVRMMQSIASAVSRALGYAEVPAKPLEVRIQRAPFEVSGVAADLFAREPRFPAARLWHVDLDLSRPVEGPLLLGDGRFYGLGLFQRVDEQREG